jgi:hypothetical protein
MLAGCGCGRGQNSRFGFGHGIHARAETHKYRYFILTFITRQVSERSSFLFFSFQKYFKINLKNFKFFISN